MSSRIESFSLIAAMGRENLFCFSAVVCDLGGQVLFGVEFLLLSDLFNKVHSEEFAGEVWDTFDEQMGLDELWAVGGDSGGVANAKCGGDSITGFTNLSGGVTDFDASSIDAVGGDNLFGALQVCGGEAELFSLSMTRYDSADEAVGFSECECSIGDGAGFKQVTNQCAGDPCGSVG